MPISALNLWVPALSLDCRCETAYFAHASGAPEPGQLGHGPDAPLIIHASCVAFGGAAVGILGPSGQGKSGLALQLMALGGALVADDRTCLWRQDGQLMADAPAPLRGRIEARGVGILNARANGPAPLRLWVDLAQKETQRLPPMRQCHCLGLSRPVLHNVDSAYFPAAILQYLAVGRSE